MSGLGGSLKRFLALIAAAAFASVCAASASAQALVTTLHSFGDISTANDGVYPFSNLVQGKDGNYYGITSNGGAGGFGTAFKMTPAGFVTTLHSFGDGTVLHDGNIPTTALIQASDGNFYGMTIQGGSSNVGTIFKMTTKGVVTILHSFQDGSVANDGEYPVAALIQATDGNLYGVTQDGGANNKGTLFKINTAGKLSVLHSFGDSGTLNDATYPNATLVQASDGLLYSTSQSGGSTNGGTIFKTTTGGVVTTMHTFGDGSVSDDGIFPEGGLMQATDGNFYGTTLAGGASDRGTVFKMTPAGTVTIQHSFVTSTPNGGFGIQTLPIQGKDGALYGVTWAGGATGNGTAFKCSLDGSVFVTLHSFQSASPGDDGALSIVGLILGSDGSFYGTSELGGSQGRGTVFRMTINETTLHSFEDPLLPNDGAVPFNQPIRATDGNFYGVTVSGGSKGMGAVYKTTPAGATTILHSFGDGTVTKDGAEPAGVLVQASDGNLYGVTEVGGKDGFGTVFKITTSGTVTILHSFQDGSITNDGAVPYAGLVLGRDGELYGTTINGGAGNSGVIYKTTTAGKLSILHSFSDGTVASDGAYPYSPLLAETNGNFYGVTYYGGSADLGALFQVTPSGTVTILHSFGDGTVTEDGTYPDAAPVQGTDGMLYGTTSHGGTASGGAIYVFDFYAQQAYDYALKHSFGDGTTPFDAFQPNSSLVLAPSGGFYGTSVSGGTAGGGTIFEMLYTGATVVLHSFGDGATDDDGTQPFGGLTFTKDGNLYGAAANGGANGSGTVYEFIPSPPVAAISVVQSTLISGKSTTGLVSLSGSTQLGGAFICLSSSDPSITVSPVIETPAGSNATSFLVTAGSVTATKTVMISASAGGSTVSIPFNVIPAPDVAALAIDPTTVIGGVANSTGTITLNEIAPSGGLKVTFTSSNTAAATVPSSIMVAAGASTATFTITSETVPSTATSTITASGGGTSATAILTVNPVVSTTITKISLNPASVTGGHSSTATVTLSGPAPSGGQMVSFKSGNTAIVPTPATITIAAGATIGTVKVTTKAVTTSTPVSVEAYATDAGHQSATLTLNP